MASRFNLKLITDNPAVVLATLTIMVVVIFLLVNRLVKRFSEEQLALGRKMYAEAQAAMASGKADRGIEDFRAALSYDPDNYQYQLSLARALRDTGRTAEAEAYLLSLWEHSPQDGAVNLALGRLAARERQLDKTLQYYHNAIYGVWTSNADNDRLNAWFELVQVLLQLGAKQQAEAELISLAAELPHRPDLELRVAELFTQIPDFDHALAEYRRVLQLDRGNVTALTGAGEAAFSLGRYRTADHYLQSAAKANPRDKQAAHLLETSNMVLLADPYAPQIYGQKRLGRIRAAFEIGGERLQACAQSKGVDLKSASTTTEPQNDLQSLHQSWLDQKRRMTRGRNGWTDEMQDQIMNLVFRIEQQTAQECGPPIGANQALLILSQNPNGVER